MKNKLLSLLLVICLMFPAALFLTACKKKDDEDTTPPPPTALEILNTANTNLEAIMDNTTATIIPTATITSGYRKVYGGADCAITLKTDGIKTELIIPETLAEEEILVIMDGKDNYYSKTLDGSWAGTATNGESFYKYIEEMTELDDVIKGISDVAHFYQSAPLKLVTEDNNKYLSLDLDIGTRINNALILNYRENHDAPLAVFLNTMLSDLAKKEVDVAELVDDFALTMTEDTTVMDFVEYLSTELGFSIDFIVDVANILIEYTNEINAGEAWTHNLVADYNTEDYLYAGHYDYVAPIDLEMLDEMAMLPLFREAFEDDSLVGADLSMMFESMFADEYAMTLDDVLLEMGGEAEEIMYFLENTTINTLGLNIKITLDENNKPTKLLFTVIGDGSVREDSTTELMANIKATAEVTFAQTGTTTVTLPRANSGEEIWYYFEFVVDEETFKAETADKFTFKADSSIVPENFTIIARGEEIATFNKATKNLQVRMDKIKDIIDAHYTAGDKSKVNVYELADRGGTHYYINFRVG